jgi:hypothetical protein
LPVALHIPSVPPHGIPGETQWPSALQQRLFGHVLLSQQSSPWPPHVWHWPAAHTKPERQLVRLGLAGVGQQGSPRPPQPRHWPAAQLPRPIPHDIDGPTHMPPTQQPVPPAQMSPGQQGKPCVPHGRQTPLALQARLDLHVRPGQHDSFISPHDAHLPGAGPAHTVSGVAQAFPMSTPMQQALPSAPQLAQRPFMHAPPVVPHIPPAATHLLPKQQPPALHC